MCFSFIQLCVSFIPPVRVFHFVYLISVSCSCVSSVRFVHGFNLCVLFVRFVCLFCACLLCVLFVRFICAFGLLVCALCLFIELVGFICVFIVSPCLFRIQLFLSPPQAKSLLSGIRWVGVQTYRNHVVIFLEK